MNEEFSDATVITIAHRLNTIIKSDMVLVLDEGRMMEYDTPSNLMKIVDILKQKPQLLYYDLNKTIKKVGKYFSYYENNNYKTECSSY